ncbi:hypothetical protein [Streptomyces sp. TS71-3]|uniref:hypothetical protein n=1 Tax=Streptomyces sp. TS71-3 TaxID=2733862 RepID=UPI001BB3AE5E|nr:hypothetical protein [Streptomyces sp. TS71-3]
MLITRLAVCWRSDTFCELRENDANEITDAEGLQICTSRYKVDKTAMVNVRARRRAHPLKTPTTSWREEEWRSAPSPPYEPGTP